MEGWKVWEGVYFSYCVLTTIGYGDYQLKQNLSKALFIWHVIIGIGALTYFTSMVAERALDQWSIEMDKIEKRMDRYETKALWKKMYPKRRKSVKDFFEPGPSKFESSFVTPQGSEESSSENEDFEGIRIPSNVIRIEIPSSYHANYSQIKEDEEQPLLPKDRISVHDESPTSPSRQFNVGLNWVKTPSKVKSPGIMERSLSVD